MRGENIKKTDWHDAGAYGRCSYCGTYCDDMAYVKEFGLCDCGSRLGFDGTFNRPTENSRWIEVKKE